MTTSYANSPIPCTCKVFFKPTVWLKESLPLFWNTFFGTVISILLWKYILERGERLWIFAPWSYLHLLGWREFCLGSHRMPICWSFPGWWDSDLYLQPSHQLRDNLWLAGQGRSTRVRYTWPAINSMKQNTKTECVIYKYVCSFWHVCGSDISMFKLSHSNINCSLLVQSFFFFFLFLFFLWNLYNTCTYG